MKSRACACMLAGSHLWSAAARRGFCTPSSVRYTPDTGAAEVTGTAVVTAERSCDRQCAVHVAQTTLYAWRHTLRVRDAPIVTPALPPCRLCRCTTTRGIVTICTVDSLFNCRLQATDICHRYLGICGFARTCVLRAGNLLSGDEADPRPQAWGPWRHICSHDDVSMFL